jgi:transposase-like protein
MSDLFKCSKCGKKLNNKFDKESHEKECHGMSINLETIQLIAEKGIEGLTPPVTMGFKCDICGDFQPIDEIEMIRTKYMSLICDNCKKDLKEIILTKRKKNERAG